MVIDGVEPTYRFASQLPAAEAVVQRAAAQPGAAVAAAAAAQPAPLAQPAAARAPRLVPAVAVAAPLLRPLRSCCSNVAREAGTATAHGSAKRTSRPPRRQLLSHPSATQGNPVAAVELAAHAFGSLPVRKALGDQLRQTDSMASFKAALARTRGGHPPNTLPGSMTWGRRGSRRAAGTERKLARSLLNALLNER